MGGKKTWATFKRGKFKNHLVDGTVKEIRSTFFQREFSYNSSPHKAGKPDEESMLVTHHFINTTKPRTSAPRVTCVCI